MNKLTKNLISLVAGIVIIVSLFFLLSTDAISVEIQTLTIIMLCIVLAEGLGLKSVADYMELDNSFLVYIPVVRQFKLGEIVSYAGYELFGKLRLQFYTAIIGILTITVSLIIEAGELKAILLLSGIAILILHFIFKTIALALIAKTISGVGSMIAVLVIIPQTVIAALFKYKIRALENAELDEEEDNNYYEEDYEDNEEDYR